MDFGYRRLVGQMGLGGCVGGGETWRGGQKEGYLRLLGRDSGSILWSISCSLRGMLGLSRSRRGRVGWGLFRLECVSRIEFRGT